MSKYLLMILLISCTTEPEPAPIMWSDAYAMWAEASCTWSARCYPNDVVADCAALLAQHSCDDYAGRRHIPCDQPYPIYERPILSMCLADESSRPCNYEWQPQTCYDALEDRALGF